MDSFQIFIFALIGSGVGAYFGSYLKKKGENLATHGDIQKLVDQMTAVTQATKEIEAKISNDVWERQRRGEVKREALFEALKGLADVEYALLRLIITFEARRTSIDENGERRTTDRRGAVDKWNLTLVGFKRSRILVHLVSSQGLKSRIDYFEHLIGTLANNTVSGDENVAVTPSFETIREEISALTQLVRDELD